MMPQFRLRSALATLVWSLVFVPVTLVAQVTITELMAVADENYPDADGAPSDWIELTNLGSEIVSLEGYHLTNNLNDPTRWTFPAVSLKPGEALVIIASGKDRPNPAELHANFALDRDGDELALIAPDGVTVVSEVNPGQGYPEQRDQISYGYGLIGLEQTSTAVPRGAPLRYLVPQNGDLGASWTEGNFDDSGWTEGTAGIGFETPGGPLSPLVTTDIRSEMYAVNASIYLRFPFELDLNDRQVLSLELDTYIDDGFVAYLNGVEIGSFGKTEPLSWNSSSNESRSDSVTLSTPITIELGGFQSALVNGTNVLALQAMNFAAGNSDMVADLELKITTLSTESRPQYAFLTTPTPGRPNGLLTPAPPSRVLFSETSRMFTGAFELTLACDTPGAVIRYTTDLSVPTAESPIYESPIPISDSTQVRARAFLEGAIDGTVTTHSFLKMAEGVPEFSSNLPVIVISTLGTGSPPDTGSTTRKECFMFFFEPDPETGRTVLSQSPKLTTRAGIRRRGSSSGYWPKYSLSVETWNDGDDDDRNIEPLGMAREADWILNARYEWDLALMRNPFVYEISRQIGRYAPRTRFVEVFSDTSGNEVADLDYFGVYSLIERIEIDENRVDIEHLRPWENREAEITGGYIFKNDRPDPGEPTMSVAGMGQLTNVDPGGLLLSSQQRAWLVNHLNQLNAALTNRTDGTNPTTGLHFSDYIDVDSWLDHHLLNILVMNIDWGRHSAFFHKDRGGKIVSGPVWDFDRSLGCEDVRDNNPRAWEGGVNAVGTVSSKTWYDDRYPWYGHLIGPTADPAGANFPDVRQRHTDRWFRLREREFSTENLHAVIDAFAAEIREAQARNFERWTQYPPNGGNFADPGLTGWEAEVSHMKNWLATRAAWVDEQYPARPLFNTEGGAIEVDFGLVMGSPDGAVYYTIDGSDPRAPGGEPSTSALVFPGGPITETFIDPDTSSCRFLVPQDGSLGLSWTAAPESFDDRDWTAGINGVGYESIGGISELIQTDITRDMKGVNASCYVRFEFDFDNAENANSALLSLWADDGFVAYLNGTEVGSLLKPAELRWDSTTDARQQRPGGDDAVLSTPVKIDLTPYLDQLRNGGNVIAIHGLNNASGSADFLVRTRLEINHNVSPEPLAIEETVSITARTYNGSTWSAPSQATLVAGSHGANPANLVISEIMYHPAPPSAEEVAAGFRDQDLFEYLEILNVGSVPLALTGLRFLDGITFDFNLAPGAVLPAGGCALLVRNRDAFAFRYGEPTAAAIIGEFSDGTGLSNSGERLTLQALDGSPIHDFFFRDQAPWPTAADGEGYSLVLVDPAARPDHANPANWQSSPTPGGSPGHSEALDFATWAAPFGHPVPTSDNDGDQRNALLEFAEGTDPQGHESPGKTTEIFREPGGSVIVSFRRNLRASGITIELESSPNLEDWQPAGPDWTYLGEQNLGDGHARVYFRSHSPGTARYLRQRMTLR